MKFLFPVVILFFQNLNQNPRTLLPKFYGLFCYQVSTVEFLVKLNIVVHLMQLNSKSPNVLYVYELITSALCILVLNIKVIIN